MYICFLNFLPCLDHKKDPDKQLSIKEITEIYEEIHSVTALWYEVGMAMNLGISTLDAIEKETRIPRRCLIKVLTAWLQQTGTDRTWRFLANALATELVGRTDLKESILGA